MKKKKKAQHPVGFEPTASRVSAPEACAPTQCFNRCPNCSNYFLVGPLRLFNSHQNSGRIWRSKHLSATGQVSSTATTEIGNHLKMQKMT